MCPAQCVTLKPFFREMWFIDCTYTSLTPGHTLGTGLIPCVPSSVSYITPHTTAFLTPSHPHSLTPSHPHTVVYPQEAKCVELGQELVKGKEEVSSLNIKVKWAQNKLKTETETHKV